MNWTPLLVTLRTDKRLFASVKSTMTHQIATLFELLVTLWTDFSRTGFSTMWILRWLINSPLFLNFLSHSGQTNGFSPVWSLRWLIIRHFVWTSCHTRDRQTASHQCELYDDWSTSHFVWTSCHTLDRQPASHHFWKKKIFFSKIWNKYFEKCRRQKWHPLLDELEQTAPQSIISLAQNNVLNFLILQTYLSAMISYQSVPQLAILASSLTLTCPSLIKSTLYPNLAMFTFETSVEFAIFLVFLQPLFELLVTLWTDNRLLTTFEIFFFQKSEINTFKNVEGLGAAPPSHEGVLV